MKHSLLLFISCAMSLTLSAREWFVDANAAAGGDGSRAKPFSTVVAARDAARQARASGMMSATEGVVITLLPGEYPQVEQLVLDGHDSGRCEYAPTVIRAEKPHTVRFTGGVVLKAKDFSRVSDPAVLKLLPEEAQSKARVADVSKIITKTLKDLPHDFIGVQPAPLVFMRGKIVECARWPNAGEYAQFSQPDRVDNRAFVLDNPRAKRWSVERGIWLCGYWTHDWAQDVNKVDHFGPEDVVDKDEKKTRRENVVRFDKMFRYGVMEGTYGGHKGRRFYAMNLLEELDAPGEWYYDRVARKLYVIPLDGKEVRDDDDVILAVNSRQVLWISSDARYLRIEGIDFIGAVRDLVSMSARDSVLENCRFSCSGNGALVIGGGARRMRVKGCDFEMIGGTGIALNAGVMKTLERGEVVVEDCRVHDFGQINRTYNGAFVINGVGNTIRKCEFWNAPHLAILNGGANNVFEYNNIHHVLLETADAGAYYSGRVWSTQGNILRYNYFHDLGRIDASCVAIYYDDCGSGEIAYGNVIHKAGLAFMVGGGRDHPVRGNVISSCLTGICLTSRGMEWPSFNADPSAQTKRGDRSSLLRERAINLVDYETRAWLDAYPRLANVMNDEWAMPYYDAVENNIFIDVKGWIVNVSKNDHFNSERMAPIAGNLIVSTTGAKGITTNVQPHIAKGFKTLVGSKERPIDLGIDSLAAGDFRFLPESVLMRECPGFDTIPFDEIPRFSEERDLRDYVALVKTVKGKQVWTAALQKALDENGCVRIPSSPNAYWIDAPIIVRSNRRINAHGATISLLDGSAAPFLKNAASASHDQSIAITGGTWCDWRRKRGGTEASPLFAFKGVDGLSITSAMFMNAAAFAVQIGEAKDLNFRHLRFTDCYAGGIRLDGKVSHVRGYEIKGSVGDDLIALGAGSVSDVVFEDLGQLPSKKVVGYGSIGVESAVQQVVFRKVRGIRRFTTRQNSAAEPSGDLCIEDAEIDLDRPGSPDSKPFAAFELGAKQTKVTLKDVTVSFHCDKYPHSLLAKVDDSFQTGELVCDGVKVCGIAPAELVSGACKLTQIPRKPKAGTCPRHVLNYRYRATSEKEKKAAKDWLDSGRAAMIRTFEKSEFGAFAANANGAAKYEFAFAMPKGASKEKPVPVMVLAERDAQFVVPTHTITWRGYALVTFKVDASASVGEVAKGFKAALDAIAQKPELDIKRVAIVGHGTDAIAALWAGANDRRVTMVIADDPDLARRLSGKRGSDLLRLMAPRLAYVSASSEDKLYDAKSEHLGVSSVAWLWRAMGVPTLSLTCAWKSVYPKMVDNMGNLGYHLSYSACGLSAYDWDQFLDFADVHLK